MDTLITLATFSGGVDGANPGYGALLMDANGDLFGTTESGGPNGGGTVFELVNTGSGYSPVTLATFDINDTVNGNTPFAGLTMDANGNLFGVTQAGGAAGSGTVFEMANTGSGYGPVQTLTSFTGNSGVAPGAFPTGTLLADAGGNLFGTTQNGGSAGDGTVFEMVKTASGYSQVTLANFNFDNGAAPTGPLVMDADGDLFGTTLQGGSGGQGTVFELAHGASGYGSVATLANFDGSNGSFLYAGLAMDAHGDLFGTTYSGGANSNGTVFELVNNGSGYDFKTIATLDLATTGGFAIGGLIIDSQGDIFGTAIEGGGGDFGTVFELTPGASGYSVHTVHEFGGPDGGLPEATLLLDASGNLYGATAGGGDGGNGAGTVFEITAAAPSDGGAAEQAALALKVNGGSGNPIGEAGAGDVAFTVTGLQSGDTGVVTFTDGADHTVTVTVAAGQTHYAADLSGLANGSISASLQLATNSAGDSFTPVAGNAVTLDTVAPGQPGAPGDASVSNGYVDAAHDTSSQAIGGVVEAGAAVAIYDNGALVTTVTADNSGAWSYQVGTLADGAHSFAVTATDAAGNTSVMSAALNFTVDATAPAQPGAPTDGAVSNGYVNAAHDTGGQAIGGTVEASASVAVYDNGHLVTTVTADNAGAWSYQVGLLADGSSHSYAVTATDAAGNTSAMSAALSFTVDASAPGAPTGLEDATVAGGWVNAAGDVAGQSLTGTAEGGALVTIYDNGVKLGATTADGTGAWSFALNHLAEGAQSLTATATDAAGNTGAASGALAFTVDTLAPASAVSGVSVGADGVATVGGSAEAGSSVSLYDGQTLVGTVTAGAGGTWSYAVGVLDDGSSHSYAVTATDAAGNTSALSQALSYTPAAAPADPPAAPTGLADAAIVGGYVNQAHDVAGQSVTGKAAGGATVTVYDNGLLLGTTTANAVTGAWSFTLNHLAEGAQSLTATATDAAGNTGAASAALAFTVDTTAPTPVVNNVTDAGKGQSTVSGTSEAGSKVTLFDNGQQVGAAKAGADGSWSVTLKLNGGQVHALTETAIDLAGNSGASTGAAYWANPANKSFVGAGGDDVFIGGKGDSLTGGGGHNHFVFNAGFGNQTVTNFSCGSDQLWFDHTLFGNLSQVLAHAHQSGANAVIADAAGDQIVLQSIQCANLQAGDFHFF